MSGSENMLASLIAQAEGDGADLVMIRALVEEASHIGAQRILHELGLSDRGARDDMRELRELLRAWRDAKSAARGAAIGWLIRAGLALMLLGMAVKLGLFGMVRA